MPLSKKKQEKAERQQRIDYVLSVSITNHLVSPFMDANEDSAARRYIETGDESLKKQFSSTVRRPINKKANKRK